LQVFCAHIFFVFVGLALLYSDVPQLHGWVAITLLAVTFAGLVLVAVREVRKQREDRARREARSSEAPPEAPPSIQLRTEPEPLAASSEACR
jgi:hypothetical protein